MAKALVIVDGVDLPTPSTYSGATTDIVDAARNTSGYVVGSMVREDVAKVEMSWNYLTVAQWSTILKLFNSTYGGKFYQPVEFFNQVTGDWETRTMYPGDRTTGGAIPRLDSVTGAPIGWEKPVLHLIEQ